MATNVLRTGVDVTREDVASWLRAVIPAYCLFGAAILVVTAAAQAGSFWPLLGAGVLLIFATVLYDATLRRQRALKGAVARLLRTGLGAMQLAFGLWLTLFVHGDGWKFLGIASLAFVVAMVLAELRYSIRWRHARGPVVLCLALVLVLLGLFPIAAISVAAGFALAGIGVVTAVVGGELHAEDWLRAVRRPSSRSMRIAGTGLVAIAGGALVAAGSEPAYVMVLIVVLIFLVATVSSDSDSAEVALVLVGAFVWAAAPRDVSPPPSIDPKPGEPFFVALGDSYISGEGAQHYFLDTNDKRANQCRRAPTAYPVLLADRGGAAIPDDVLFLACSGAHAVDLHGPRPRRTEPLSQLDQYRQALAQLDEGDIKFVLLSIGGNDADFGVVGRTCVGPGDCSEIGQRWVDKLQNVEGLLNTAYAKVAEEVGSIPVYVVPYPMPLAPHGCWWSWLTDDEHRFLSAFVGQLNRVVESAARRHGFHFVETNQAAFVAEKLRICDRFIPYGLGMNFFALHPTSGSLGDVVDPRNWTHNSLHPNEIGHHAMLQVVQRRLTSPPTSVVTETGAVRHRIEELDEVVAGSQVDQCGEKGSSTYCSQDTSAWIASQATSLLRLTMFPIVVLLAGSWMIVMPSIRWANENRFNLSRPLLALLRNGWWWLRSVR